MCIYFHRKGISNLRQESVTEPSKILSLPKRKQNILNTCKKVNYYIETLLSKYNFI